MVVVRIDPTLPAFQIIAKEKATVRLGERCPDTGNLTEVAMNRALAALQRCQTRAQSLNAEEIITVATSAMREAPNGRDFIQTVKKELGLYIDLISGPEEARRIYLGVLSGMELHQQPHVIIDIGGGSTELILGSGQEPLSLSSTKVGAVRLTSEMVTTDPISEGEFQYLRAYLRGMLERPVEDLRSHLEPGTKIKLVGTSGTIETLAMLHAHHHLGAAPDPLNGYHFSRRDLDTMMQQMRRMTVADRLEMPGMSDRRAEIIVAGALVLLEAMTLLGADSITICERALREGVIVDWMLTHGLIEDRLRFQSSIRSRSVMRAARKFHVNLAYGERVATFALSIFDQLAGKLHHWGPVERELLWAAAILHNAGHYVSHSSHHKHSYYLIRNGGLLGYTETEIEVIANLARYHRKSEPKKKHENYRNLGSKRYRRMVDQLNPILRLAVALDRQQAGAIAQVTCVYDGADRRLALHLTPSQSGTPCDLELWSLSEKKQEFERTYGIKVLVRLQAG
ncbi:MAG: Ppx/GppA phosphatase family protein [Prochlorothrix sp.]